MRALSIDVGSSSVRSAVVDEAGAVTFPHRAPLTVRSPHPGEVELDPGEIAELAIAVAESTLRESGGVDVVGVTNQRATTVVFDVRTGRAIGPALSWQDLRTVLDCLTLRARGLRLAPNQSATKVRWLVEHVTEERSHLRFATLDTWLAWHLSRGELFVTDRTNACVTGLVTRDARRWNVDVLDALELDPSMFAPLVDSAGPLGPARALSGSPTLCALVGDQAASLFGQACVERGTKVTFGTGAILNSILGSTPPETDYLLESGCYVTAVRSQGAVTTWALEGIVLSAGACVQWFGELGLGDVSGSSALAESVPTRDGVVFVPAFSGLGTPHWDFGARGAFFGLTRGSSPAHLQRALLDGVAHRGVDLLDAVGREGGTVGDVVRVDGGMSVNRFFVQRFADLCGRDVAVSAEVEATTRGAGLMALVGVGHLTLADVAKLSGVAYVATPRWSLDERAQRRDQWRQHVERTRGTIPELSSVSF